MRRPPIWVERRARKSQESHILRQSLKRLRNPDDPPEDPYAYVPVPTRPKLPQLDASAKEKLPE